MNGTVSIDIQNLKVSSNAAEGTKHIRGTVSGINDVAVEADKGMETDYGSAIYFHNDLSFAGIQSSEGADKLAGDFGKDKPKQISYSFKVSKPSTPVTPVTPVEDHTVTFHPANGQSNFTQTVFDGSKVNKPADPTQNGYTFNGWYTDSALTKVYDFDTPVTSDFDLYAKWTKNTPAPNPAANKVTGILLPKVIANGSSEQTLTWTPLTHVDGYFVYEAECNTPNPLKVHHLKKVADVSASSPRVYKRTGLKKGVAYKYRVAAYKIKDGKKQIVKTSVDVHSAAGNLLKKKSGSRYTNVKKVSVRKNAVTLKIGKTYKIQPSVKGVYSGCAILQKDHAPMYRYLYIKDGKNISVSQNGMVKALKA
ncbi:MAG: InlB B-repeat-containing protein, partial [Eubacterium sp.]